MVEKARLYSDIFPEQEKAARLFLAMAIGPVLILVSKTGDFLAYDLVEKSIASAALAFLASAAALFTIFLLYLLNWHIGTRIDVYVEGDKAKVDGVRVAPLAMFGTFALLALGYLAMLLLVAKVIWSPSASLLITLA